MKSLYLLINFSSIIVPFIFSFHPKINFYRQWKFLFPAIVMVMAVFVPWDIWFTNKEVWGFNTKYLTGYTLFHLPLEEVLFFICIPYCCLFTIHCFEILIKKDYFAAYQSLFTSTLILLLLLIGFYNITKLYTSITFILLALVLIILKYIIQPVWLSRFYFSYLILIIPFAIVNGILTGTGINEPVVWYNNTQNLGIRIGTIPVEDIFYGMLLILLNVTVYEFLLNKNAGKKESSILSF